MGATSFFNRHFKKSNAWIAMIGLDYAGKTTILYKMKLGEVINTMPTIGFNMETTQYRNYIINTWDSGNYNYLRTVVRFYLMNSYAIIFVVDSTDIDRFDDAATALGKVLIEVEFNNAPLLVLANKQDLKNAVPPTEIANKLGLPKLKNRTWRIQGTSILSVDGLYEGFDWIINQLSGQ